MSGDADDKAAAIKAAVGDEPFSLEWAFRGSAMVARVQAVTLVPRGLQIDLSIERDGVPVAYDAPWVAINPPLRSEGGKEDPAAALREIIRSFAEGRA